MTKKTYRELVTDPECLAKIIENGNIKAIADNAGRLMDRCARAESLLRSALLISEGHDKFCKMCEHDWREKSAAHLKEHEKSPLT